MWWFNVVVLCCALGSAISDTIFLQQELPKEFEHVTNQVSEAFPPEQKPSSDVQEHAGKIVFVPQPYPVYVEKKYPVPIVVEKKVPLLIKLNKHPVKLQKAYKVIVEKRIPYIIEKPVPYKVKIPIEKKYPVHYPVEKEVPYHVIKEVPYEVKVPVDKPVPYKVEKPVPHHVEKLVPYPVVKEVPFPVKVPYRVEIKVPYKVKLPKVEEQSDEKTFKSIPSSEVNSFGHQEDWKPIDSSSGLTENGENHLSASANSTTSKSELDKLRSADGLSKYYDFKESSNR